MGKQNGQGSLLDSWGLSWQEAFNNPFLFVFEVSQIMNRSLLKRQKDCLKVQADALAGVWLSQEEREWMHRENERRGNDPTSTRLHLDFWRKGRAFAWGDASDSFGERLVCLNQNSCPCGLTRFSRFRRTRQEVLQNATVSISGLKHF